MTAPRAAYSIVVYNYGRDELYEIARHAERLGFDALWFGEHYVMPRATESPHPAGALKSMLRKADVVERQGQLPDTPLYDPWAQAAAVSAVTKRLKVGTAVCIVPINNPLLLARQALTVHEMSGGRLLFGAGAGWLKEEFDAVGVPFEERGARLDEGLDILRKAWAGGYFSHAGTHFQFGEVRLTPAAAKVPLVCGGNVARALRRAARVGDAWINSGAISPDQAVQLRATIQKEREAQGTADRPFDFFIRPGATDPDQIRPYLDAGFANIVLGGYQAWAPSPNFSLQDKVRRLEQTARGLSL